MFRITLSFAILSFFLMLSPSYADVCEAILKYGVRDRSKTLDTYSKINLAKQSFCEEQVSEKEGSGGIGISVVKLQGGYGEKKSSKVCSAEASKVINDAYSVTLVEKINKDIVQAWSDCIKGVQGVYHYFETTDDPSIFNYVLGYNGKAKPYEATVEKWTMLGSLDCDEAVSKGDKVSPRERSHLCQRDPKRSVKVAVDTDKGRGHLISLPAVRETTFKELYVRFSSAVPNDTFNTWSKDECEVRVDPPITEQYSIKPSPLEDSCKLTVHLNHGTKGKRQYRLNLRKISVGKACGWGKRERIQVNSHANGAIVEMVDDEEKIAMGINFENGPDRDIALDAMKAYIDACELNEAR